ncbi:MAG: hypothetical protein IJ925_04280, partial [Muribaculaceae bacterium]|nr:hypothetical protein [Muribaculaceae bacterium]
HIIRRKVDKKKWNDQIPDALFVLRLGFSCRFFRQDRIVGGFLQCVCYQRIKVCALKIFQIEKYVFCFIKST